MEDLAAIDLAREWLNRPIQVTPLEAMNSSTWRVDAGNGRFVLKVSSPADEPGLRVAAWLAKRGVRTGAPYRLEQRDGRLVALLRFEEGRALVADDAETVGSALGRVHSLLARAPVPTGLARWPWPWLDAGDIRERDLRKSASAAVTRAEALAPGLTHGILHGDPAPEAFLDMDGDVAVIDWGAACHGPLLYDLASAWMYTRQSEALVEAYSRTGLLLPAELTHVPDFLALRWAVQAWYFSRRLAGNDLTGLDRPEDNEKGLTDARRALLG